MTSKSNENEMKLNKKNGIRILKKTKTKKNKNENQNSFVLPSLKIAKIIERFNKLHLKLQTYKT